ncbi:hypothetical protein [Lacinutrix neustonica]|uniref:hypothetical protein n=1 Tax=Lacinutrix neustonica TaxID=2980107 RepID=UPI0028BDECB7|nr:hypothetical protein [Lacinutrix neustonica]
MKELQYVSVLDYTNEGKETLAYNLSYRTFGEPLHTAPIVMVIHALTGNSNVCGPKVGGGI